MKIAKKVIIALAVIVLLVIAITFISIKYEENQKKSDQALALDCAKAYDGDLEKYDIDWDIFQHHYFLIESSPESRSTEDYYKRAFQLISDVDYEIIDEKIANVEGFDFWSDSYGISRTNKYIHLFDWLETDRNVYKLAQDKLEIHEELIDEIVAGRHEYRRSFIPTFSINRETLKLTKWNTVKSLSASMDYVCKEIDPSILHNRVKASEEKAKGGLKKI